MNWRRFVPYAVLFVSGAVSSLGFAPLDLWPLTLLSLGILLERLLRAANLRAAFVCGWLFGLGHFIVGLNWIATAFTYQASMPAWLGAVAVVLLSMYLALFPAVAGALAWKVARKHEAGFVFAIAAAWMLGEWARANLLTGFAWNPIGVVWLSVPFIAQDASGVGAYGLSAFALLLGGVLWLTVRRRTRVALGMVLAITAIHLLLGASTRQRKESVSVQGIPIRVVQPNIGQDEKYESGQAARHARIYAQLSGKPSSSPRVLLWPEAATLRLLELEPEARAELLPLLGPGDMLITGGASVSLDPSGINDVYHNSVFALDSSGRILWRYDKAHLVPFGEYLPLRGLLEPVGLSRLVPGDGDFTAGPGPRTFRLPGFHSAGAPATVGLQICYEIIFSGHVVDRSARPSFLFNPSNDAWFGSWGPHQHLAQARIRAIEEGLPVVRATPNGISAVISASGEVLMSIARHQSGVIDFYLPEAGPPTVFARFGAWTYVLFAGALATIGLAISGIAARRSAVCKSTPIVRD